MPIFIDPLDFKDDIKVPYKIIPALLDIEIK